MENQKLLDALRSRLKEIDVEHGRLASERDHITALLAVYGAAINGNGKPPVRTERPLGAYEERELRKQKQRTIPANAFQPRPGGPTERIMQVVSEFPGLTYSQVITKALEGLETDANKPRESIGSTLGSLVKRGRIVRRGSAYYADVGG